MLGAHISPTGAQVVGTFCYLELRMVSKAQRSASMLRVDSKDGPEADVSERGSENLFRRLRPHPLRRRPRLLPRDQLL